ncbi:MAG: hypothetical protein L0Z07_02015 [Planctomycetes bacterium]|nr:hypothetical protein [Planctomycetota bacterium]
MYLHRKHVISAEQLLASLEAQHTHLVPIGQLALEEGIISASDIFAILLTQHEVPRERFGEVAIDLGLMTREDLMRLLWIQSDRKRSLADILVQQRVLTEDQAAAELAAYRAELIEPAGKVRMTVMPPKARRKCQRREPFAVAIG